MANRRNHNEEQSNHPACAACKNQRKRCASDCILRRHFPATKSDGFMAVHRIFGVANVTKMMREARSLADQDEIARSLYWEAAMWVQDPVRGPYGSFSRLRDEIRVLREHLNRQRLLLMQNSYNNSLFHENMMMMNYNNGNIDRKPLIMEPGHNYINGGGGDNNSVAAVGQRRQLQEVELSRFVIQQESGNNNSAGPLINSGPYSQFKGNDFVSNNGHDDHIIGSESNNVRVSGINVGFNEALNNNDDDHELDVAAEAFSSTWQHQNYTSSKNEKIQQVGR